MSATTKNQTYYPQLDALRFFAILGVMVVHFWHPRQLPWLLRDLDWGGLGVRLFFVLSGFLISGILLDSRRMAEESQRSPFYFIRQFYIRRFLRIFPIYYLVIFIGLLVNLPPAREVWLWLLTYTSNVYITFNNTWIGSFGHFWTLAVEEQFYFLWPWLILFLPRKWLVPSMLCAIAIGPVYRTIAYINFPFDIGAMDFKAGTLTPGSLDSLAIGSLLALLFRSELKDESLNKILSYLVLPAGMAIYLVSLILYHYQIQPIVFFTLGDLGTAMMFAWLIGAARSGFKGPIGKLLEFKLLIYLGKITYGIYVYHNFVPPILVAIFGRLGIPFHTPGLLSFIVSGTVSVLIASLSWRLFELPINSLKNRFPYAARPAALSPAPDLVKVE